MTAADKNSDALLQWVDPEISVLNVRETAASPGIGADIGGNAAPDCQLS